MSSANKVTVNKTTNVVTVTSPGTVGPQGGSGTIESATATATEVAVSGAGASGDPTVSVTLGGTASARTMAFAFGVPTGASAHTGAPLTIGEDDTGYDVTFFGDTSGSLLKWDASEDALELTDSTPFKIGDDAAGDMTLYHNGTDSYITNKTGELKLATETSGIAVKIGHTTSETTVNDNLTVTGDLTVSGTTTTVDTTVTVSDAVVVNNAGSDIGLKVNSTSSGHIMQLQDDGSDVFVVNDGGKVAVGVPGNAASLLHLRGPSGADTDLRLEGTPGSADGVVANIDAYHGSNNVGKIRFKRGADAADGEIEFFTANDTLNSAAMHIDQNNKVGINTVTPSTPLDVNGTATATAFAGPLTGNVTGNVTGDLTGDVTGNADTATALETARTIGGVSFDGTGNINLPGVNATGNQATSGNAATATALATGRTIGMTGDVVWTSASFDGSGNVTGTAAIQANSVALSTDTTGDYTATITAGTGLTSTGATSGEGIAHSLSVDASQTQITEVGTITTGTWEGTTVAVAQGGTGVTSKTGTGNVVLSSSPTLVTPALGTPASGVLTSCTGTASGLTAGNVTTNANLTGHVTSSGNAATLGSFTVAQLSSALSDASISGNNTGDLTNGIANTNNVVIDHASVADDDYAKFTASGVEGRSATEVKTDISLNNVENTALSTWAGTSNVTTLGTIGTGTWNGAAVDQTYIADQAINEAKMQVSNGPTNGYVLTARSGDTGGMTWEAAGTGFDTAGTGVAMAIALG